MTQRDMPLLAHLFYIQLGSPAPERMARFYGELFGTGAYRSGDAWICRGPSRCVAFSEGEANTLVRAGYATPLGGTLRSLAARARRSLAELSRIDSELFQPGAIALRDPDGNHITFGQPHEIDSIPLPEAPPARLQHLVLASAQPERLTEFYTNVVGLRVSDEVRDDNGALRAGFLRTDHEHHSFAIFRAPANRLDHHCYELPDWNAIRDWGDRLAALEVPIRWGPGRHGPGNNLFLFFHDPDANWVELSAELEQVPGERLPGVWRHEERTLNLWGKGYLRS